jgi:hypothetical protein
VATSAARLVEAARLAEHQAFDAHEAAERRLEVYALGGAAALAAFILGLLAFARPAPRMAAAAVSSVPATPPAARQANPPSAPLDLSLQATPPPAMSVARRDSRKSPIELPRGSAPALKAAADLCTEFGRVKDLPDLTRLLGRAADMMDASGVIVWLGNSSGGDLRPVLAHGYTDETLSRIPSVPRSADNAAAAAYRSGSLQIVLTRPGTSSGAVVAPLLSSDGPIGAFTAEIRDRGETSDSVQALSAIFAAQLAGVLSASASASAALNLEPSKTATG